MLSCHGVEKVETLESMHPEIESENIAPSRPGEMLWLGRSFQAKR